MSAIQYLILDKIETDLTQALITDISKRDPARATLVKVGRMQEKPGIYACVEVGDPEDVTVHDGGVDTKDMERAGLSIPGYEIGGGKYWWRRGTVKVGCFLQNSGLAEKEATDVATTFLGRTMNALSKVNVHGLTDDFGEGAMMLLVYGNTFFQSGGPPNQYIWRGTIRWECLTHRPH